PWFDNLNTGATNWSTFTDPSLGGADWTLGIPNNSLATSAHSPPDAWGSNLEGQSIDTAEAYLISPAIYLTNGNIAMLSFWHDYDFSDLSGYDIEYGEVDVIDANTGASISLAQFNDISGDWIEEQFDLTPYAGKVVYLVWSYVLFSFDSAARPGWLI